MREGIIIAGVSSFYDVFTEGEVVRCKARGSFRKQQITPVIGDRVEYSEKLYLEKILPRTSHLIRPPVANVDQAVLVMAAHTPEPNIRLLDRFLAEALQQQITPVLVINKWDLAEPEDPIYELVSIYQKVGFRVITACTRTGQGIDEIRECLKDHMTVFAGPSGVGKSSLLNRLVPGLGQETGELSEKIQRGKNTTRHSKLVPLAEGGFVADTPGFTSLYLDHLKYEDLEQYYPEFDDWRDQCRFYGCSHISEPGCGVKAGLANGAIHQQRYDNYVELYKEIRKSNEENRYT